MTDPNELMTLQMKVDQDPRVRAIVQNGSVMSRFKQEHLARLGLVPQGFYIDEQGRVQQMEPAWKKYIAPAAIAGTAGVGAFTGIPGLAAGMNAAASPAATSVVTPTVGAPIAGGAGAGLTVPTVDAAAPAASKGLAGWLKALAPAAGLALPHLLPGGDGGSGQDILNNPQLKELMGIGLNRVRSQQPLHDAVTKLALSLLPNQKGVL